MRDNNIRGNPGLEYPQRTMNSGASQVAVRASPLMRYAYYLFIFSVPIETINVGLEEGVFSLSKLTGIMLIAVALSQPKVSFKKPPMPFWCFLTYILICLGLANWHAPLIRTLVTTYVFTLGLLLVLFWVSCNVLKDKVLVKGALLSFIGSCIVLAGLMLGGSGQSIAQGRMTALSQNANVVGATLSLGLLSLLGLVYGRDDMDRQFKYLAWLCFGGMMVATVATGSRTAMVAFFAGMFVFVVARRGDVVLKTRVVFIGLLALAGMVLAVSQNDAVRLRWEKAILYGDQSRREEIHPAAWDMFLQEPLFGWGPVSHYMELGYRFSRPALDPHQQYLWVMIETGLLGSIPFFTGLWICWRSGWRAGYGSEGPLPIALLTCLYVSNLAGTFHLRKVFWIVLAYNLASEAFVSRRGRSTYGADSIKRLRAE